MDAEQVEPLEELGLTSYEARAYVALVEGASLTAEAVADAADVPLGRVYDVLNTLVESDLVHAGDGRPKSYRPVDPATAIDRLSNRRIDELVDRRTAIEAAADRGVTLLEGLHAETPPEEFATSALRDEAARALLHERFEATEESIDIVVRSLDMGAEWRDAFADQFARMLERGITIRLLTTSADTDPTMLQEMIAAGLDVRVIEEVPTQRFMLLDADEVCLEVVHPATEADLLGVVDLRDPAVADELQTSFESMWASASDLDLTPTRE